ncbi:hypothetical protein ABZ807_31640, partial [Micromonospora sp. NPDC047548]|uniref:hypothetical protein n=1 Tax=Micromonospora sp. NPDC047548 TaxID=3155624 RepID=UPI0033C707AD
PTPCGSTNQQLNPQIYRTPDHENVSLDLTGSDLGLSGEDLAEDQLSAEQVLNDQDSHPALTTGWVAGVPILHIVRVTGIRSPAAAQYRPQHLQVNRGRD